MVTAIVHQLTRGMTMEQIKELIEMTKKYG